MGDSSRADETRYDLARGRARGLLTLTHQRPPVDVQAIIDLAGIPVVERALPDGTRATIGDIAGRRSIILNRRWRFSSEDERRWVLAEEFGHVPMERLLSKQYADERRKLIGPLASLDFRPGKIGEHPPLHPSESEITRLKIDDALMARDTTCVDAIDKNGMMFSSTPSGAA